MLDQHRYRLGIREVLLVEQNICHPKLRRHLAATCNQSEKEESINERGLHISPLSRIELGGFTYITPLS